MFLQLLIQVSGFMEDKKVKTLKKSTISVSEGSIHNLMTSLSVAYTRDNGSFGNNGYPVLRWQEPMSTMEKTYFDDIPEDIQRDLDKYLVKNAAKLSTDSCTRYNVAAQFNHQCIHFI